jgi:4-hydroxy-tetrahydrodipicolinate synthase
MTDVQFGRLVTAMITPFTPDGAIDWRRVTELVEHLIRTGTETLVVAGTTGESPTLTHEEKLELFSRVSRQADGRVKVIAGTGSNNTEASIRLTKEAEEAGVDGVMLVGPYYNKPSQEGLFRHFQAIAEATSLPVMLYNVPGRTGMNISVDTMVRLTELDNVVAIKEASGDLSQVTELASRVPERVAVYSGDDKLLLPILAVGGVGVVSVASHLVGPRLREMMDAFFAGDVRRAAQIHQRYNPLFEGLFITSNPVPVKYAMHLKGLCEPTVRLPLVPPTEAQQSQIKELLRMLNL